MARRSALFGKGGFLEHPRLSHQNWNISEVAILVHILDPRRDLMSTAELKLHSFQTIMKLDVPFDYQCFPGVAHSCFMNGNSRKVGERDAMARGKSAAVGWVTQFLYDS